MKQYSILSFVMTLCLFSNADAYDWSAKGYSCQDANQTLVVGLNAEYDTYYGNDDQYHVQTYNHHQFPALEKVYGDQHCKSVRGDSRKKKNLVCPMGNQVLTIKAANLELKSESTSNGGDLLGGLFGGRSPSPKPSTKFYSATITGGSITGEMKLFCYVSE
jgi:hypothetical protein